MDPDNPDRKLAVEFFTKPVSNPRKSEEEGRPIFEDREFIRIVFPADNKRELVAPAHEMHFAPFQREQITYADRFPESYAAFQADQEDFVTGTPLLVLGLGDAKRAELEAKNIRTVENLSGLTTSAARSLGMGGGELVRKAQAYLESAANGADVDAMRRQIDDLKAQLAEQKKPTTGVADEFGGFSDEDLRNMLTDAGAEMDGRWGRKRLIEALQEIAKEKEAA